MWQQFILAAKTEDNSGAFYLLANSKPLACLVAAWSPDKVRGREKDFSKAKDLADIWAGSQIDYPALAEASGLHPKLVVNGVNQLIGANIIFPDGTIHEAARRALGGLAAIALGVKPKPPAKEKQGQ